LYKIHAIALPETLTGDAGQDVRDVTDAIERDGCRLNRRDRHVLNGWKARQTAIYRRLSGRPPFDAAFTATV